VKDQEATENRRSKTLQYIGKDDKDEGKKITQKTKEGKQLVGVKVHKLPSINR
jgi:hypothetical protein